MTDTVPVQRRYCRVYWKALDDPKFTGVWDDDHALACWLRLLIAADMSWPSSATLYDGVNRKGLKALTDAGLVDMQSGSRYRIHGLDAERSARSESARIAAAVRWHSERTADGTAETMRPHQNGSAETMPSSTSTKSRSIDIGSTTPSGSETRARLGAAAAKGSD